MARSSACFLLIFALVVVQVLGRDAPGTKNVVPVAKTEKPSNAGVDDKKNFVTYGGVGGFAGVGANGLPFAGVGGLGGVTGLGGGVGGLGGGVGGLGGGVGGLGGGVGGLAGGGGLGGSVGGGSGVLPYP